MDNLEIKTVDLSDFTWGNTQKRESFTKEVGDSLHNIGFFVLKNHGVDLALLKAAYRCAEEFFSLPYQERVRYEYPELMGQRGYVSFGRETAKYETVADLK